jgi:hypothetical protein
MKTTGGSGTTSGATWQCTTQSAPVPRQPNRARDVTNAGPSSRWGSRLATTRGLPGGDGPHRQRAGDRHQAPKHYLFPGGWAAVGRGADRRGSAAEPQMRAIRVGAQPGVARAGGRGARASVQPRRGDPKAAQVRPVALLLWRGHCVPRTSAASPCARQVWAVHLRQRRSGAEARAGRMAPYWAGIPGCAPKGTVLKSTQVRVLRNVPAQAASLLFPPL